MLHIVLPVSLILGTRFVVGVGSIAVCFVVHPIALVTVSVRVGELSFPFGFVVLPLAFVDRSVRPLLPAPTISQIAQPLALILNTVLEPDQRFSLTGGGVVLLSSLALLPLIAVLAT